MEVVRKIFALGLIISFCMCCQEKKEITMVVGTYTHGTSEGIYTYRLNTDDLEIKPLDMVRIDHPSYLTVSPDHKFIYAVSESGAENSSVSAFAFNKEQGILTFLNRKMVDPDPCYIVFDSYRNFVATANYSGGSVSLFPVLENGSLGDGGKSFRFKGKGADPERQTKPHIHCIVISPDNRVLWATDLGTDGIHRLDLEYDGEETGLPVILMNDSSDTKLPARSGPRHMILNRKGTHAFLINEISGEAMVFHIDSENKLQRIQTIQADTCDAEGSADIHLSPDERFLYVSTRLEGDGIVVFEVDSDGKLSRVGYQATMKHPRNFTITSDGKLMLVACKDAGVIQLFNINKQTGLLKDTGKRIHLDQPVCIHLLE